MNKIDPRFLKDSGIFVSYYFWDNDDPNPRDYPGLSIILGQLKAGNELENVPINSLVYSDGTRFFPFSPTENQRYIFTSGIFGDEIGIYQFVGSKWYFIQYLDLLIPPVDEIVKDRNGITPPTTNRDNDPFAVGDKYFNYAQLKVFTVNNISNSNKITWDTGRSIADNDHYVIITKNLDVYEYIKNDGENSRLNTIYTSSGTTFFSKEDGKMYVVLDTGFVAVGGSGSHLKAETHTLTAAEITSKSFELSKSVAIGEENNILCFVAGVIQPVGTAFTVSGNTVSWDEKTLDGTLSAGDSFIIQYYATDE